MLWYHRIRKNIKLQFTVGHGKIQPKLVTI